MPKRLILRATKYGKRMLVLSKESVRQFRKYDRTKRGIATDDSKLNTGYYDAEPILTPLAIKGERFYVQPKADKRAVIPKHIVKKAKLRSGLVSFSIREPKSRDIVKSRGFFQRVRTKNIFKTRYYLESVEEVDIRQLKKQFLLDIASFPKGMFSVYGRMFFMIFTDDKQMFPIFYSLPTVPSPEFPFSIGINIETKELIDGFVDDAFDALFLKLLQPYVVDIVLVYTEVSHFRTTKVGEVKDESGKRFRK